MYSNKILIFQESTTILNARTKKSRNLSIALRIYLIFMYEEDLSLNNLQGLICHKIKPNQIIHLICVHKLDLALNNLQWLICHKTKPTTSSKFKPAVLHQKFDLKRYEYMQKSLVRSILLNLNADQIIM